MFWRNKLLLAAVEATYGTDPVPTGASNAILTRNLAITPYGGQTVSRDLESRTYGAQSQINTGPVVQVSFEVEITGSGAAGTNPRTTWLLRSCGLNVTTNAGVSTVFNPRSDPNPSSNGSVTLYFYADGQLHKVTGARGNAVLRFARGQIPAYVFTFTGFYTRPTASSNPSPTYGATFTDPLPVTKVNTPTFSLHSYSGLMESLELDLGNQVVYRNIVGKEEVLIVDRNVTAQITIEAPAIGSKDYFTAAESHAGTITLAALQLIHGITSGYIVQLDAPKVQINTIGVQESDGLVAYQLGCTCVPSSGDDEVTLTIK